MSFTGVKLEKDLLEINRFSIRPKNERMRREYLTYCQMNSQKKFPIIIGISLVTSILLAASTAYHWKY